MPDVSIPSRFLEEVPSRLIEDLGSPAPRRSSPARPTPPVSRRDRFGRQPAAGEADYETRHYSYEDEDQSVRPGSGSSGPATKFSTTRIAPASRPVSQPASGGGSIDNIANFFAARGSGSHGQSPASRTTGKTGLRQARAYATRNMAKEPSFAAKARGRCEDYSTISTARRKKAGGEIRPAGSSLRPRACNLVQRKAHSPPMADTSSITTSSNERRSSAPPARPPRQGQTYRPTWREQAKVKKAARGKVKR